MDIEAWNEGFQVLLRLEDAGAHPGALVFTVAGSLGLMGVNRSGIAVCVNALLQLSHRRDGLPVACVVRGLLACPTHGEAVDFLRRLPHASGQHYIVGGPDKLSALECSANAVRELDTTDRILHTNHPFENDDFVAPGAAANAPGSASANSRVRLRWLVQHLGAPDDSPRISDVIRALRSRDDPDHPISRRREDSDPTSTMGYTVGGAIFCLTDPPTALIAAGPPCSTSFLKFSFAP